MGDYADFSFIFICGLTLVVFSQAVQGSPGCCNGRICNNTRCECRPSMEGCDVCPDDMNICMECCYPSYLQCITEINNVQQRCCLYFPADNCRNKFFMFAQVALVCALAIAFSALGAICWRTCRGRHATSVSSLFRERETSLTSVQRFIIQRLQDRPPRYEDTNQIHLEKPPPYQEAIADTMPRSLSAPFLLNEAPSTPNTVPEGTSPCGELSATYTDTPSLQGENSTAAVVCATTEESVMKQAGTQTETADVQTTQVNNDAMSSTADTSLQQRHSISQIIDSAEMQSTQELNTSMPSKISMGIDNLAFSTEEEILNETQTSAK